MNASQHYIGLWNREYAYQKDTMHAITVLGEYLSQNGTGKVVAIFKLRNIKKRCTNCFLHRHNNEKDIPFNNAKSIA